MLLSVAAAALLLASPGCAAGVPAPAPAVGDTVGRPLAIVHVTVVDVTAAPPEAARLPDHPV
ncbi:MAG TPA: hypothetical protein VGV85_10565, partial [Longimicrobiaceae bacterium]|nr:hypothetical protein [Longimicrobiaceae bacterium]